ncbi:anti-sigma regulatory factor (Ser/Thr protein kinase) [Kitasatospora sp. SolWspMP-SS2h]|uniref:ATP-binding protein n=1 Tax=Kitasatospora sp. SolWspMP-SS2h TaxID=1305729 RepID=UPI000DB916F8|nr:ATP-binding protein [Kitasatospora sp. SolWspMP-SS2h]RAJ39966.1 anti-sigma regulatory factor (Ser/Thr protein kinase) [Kitasatospora sp. SolWspMP-SS2h]
MSHLPPPSHTVRTPSPTPPHTAEAGASNTQPTQRPQTGHPEDERHPIDDVHLAEGERHPIDDVHLAPGTTRARARETAAEPSAPMVRTAAHAREALSGLLRAAGASAEVEMQAHLVATELVTNANRHAGGITGFHARIEGAGAATRAKPSGVGRPGRLRIEVEDADARVPHADEGALTDVERWGGRGWALVLKLCSSVDVVALPEGGKRISTTVDL